MNSKIKKILAWFIINILISLTVTTIVITANESISFWPTFIRSQIFTFIISTLSIFTGQALTRKYKDKNFLFILVINLIGAIAATIVGVIIGFLIINLLLNNNYDSIYKAFSTSFLFIFPILITIGVTIISTYINRISRKKMEAESLLKEARLQSLQDRVNPHFLFNSLNTINALLHEDVLLAEKALLSLAENYRFLLKEAQQPLIDFNIEWQLTDNYMQIEKLRFSNNLQINLNKSGDFSKVKIPPLTIQPIVENCIKHGELRQKNQASINIDAKFDGNTVRIEVADNGKGVNNIKSLFTGTLGNIRGRLHYHFSNSKLEITEPKTGGLLVNLEYNAFIEK